MTHIIIAGIGGVGGFFGGLLAKHYEDSADVKITFLARGAHLAEIKKNGLQVIQGEQIRIAKPALATDNASEAGMADFIFLCTKSYDLEATIQQLKPAIDKNTILLPLLNGVDNQERIQALCPENVVLSGCAYIVSRLTQAGVVENTGNIQKLFFGLDGVSDDRFALLENLLKEAGIEATLSDSISAIVWEKFIFLSPTASSTSYYDNCIGDILADSEKMELVNALIEEVKMIALAKQIAVPADITEKTILKLKALPYQATSSMHSDFQNQKPANELESIVGYVVREGQKYQLETPAYDQVYAELKEKQR